MRYISIDLETTGLDTTKCQVLQVAMVAEDTEKPEVPVEDLPAFTCLVAHPWYEGEPVALAMNAMLLEQLAGEKDGKAPNGAQVLAHPQWQLAACAWLNAQGFARGEAIAAGKNVAGFDLRFFDEVLKSWFHHRSIDPGSTFIDWSAKSPPSLVAIKRRLGIGTPSVHDALGDARDVVRVLRQSYGERAIRVSTNSGALR